MKYIKENKFLKDHIIICKPDNSDNGLEELLQNKKGRCYKLIKNKTDFVNFINSFYCIFDFKYDESFVKDGFLYTTNGKAMTKIKTELSEGVYDNKATKLSEKKTHNFTPTMAKEVIPEHKYLNHSFGTDKEKFISALNSGTKNEIGQVKLQIISHDFNINGVKFCDAFYSRDIELNFKKRYFELLSNFGSSLTIKIYDNYKFKFSTSEIEIINHNQIIIEDENSNQLVLLPLSQS